MLSTRRLDGLIRAAAGPTLTVAAAMPEHLRGRAISRYVVNSSSARDAMISFLADDYYRGAA